MEQHALTAGQFGSKANDYLTSTVHASGSDLVRLEEFAGRIGACATLDLGCGAGHASYALARAGVQSITAYDLAPAMLEVVTREANARGHRQIRTAMGAAEDLPFAEASFDLVVTRYSAHHWLDVERALREVARVLTPGGHFVAIDVLAPASALLDIVLQTVELLRDPSHVRDHRASEWHAMLSAANLSVHSSTQWKLPMDFSAWVTRSGTSVAGIDALKLVFDSLPSEAREYFALASDHSFSIDAGWFDASLGARFPAPPPVAHPNVHTP